MSILISAETQARLVATADSEGVSVDAFVERLMDEREELLTLIEGSEAYLRAASLQQVRSKLERGYAESKCGEVVDGDTFMAKLLSDIEKLEQTRRME